MYLKLSDHLVQNWDFRVGEVPTEKDVNELIGQAKLIQHGRQVTTGDLCFRILSIYWHVDRGLIITADPYSGKVVSVYTAEMESPFGVGSRLGGRRRG
jgi:hypothetical protein